MTTQNELASKHVLAASDLVAQLCASVRAGEQENATVYTQLVIHQLEAMLGAFGIELLEVLPLVACSRCKVEVAEHRKVGAERLCMVCFRESALEEGDLRASFGFKDADEGLTRDGCLELARKAVDDRGKNYGPPGQLFNRIATMWGALLGQPVGAADVARCMIALKLARLGEDPKHADSWADAAGYAACGAETAGGGW